MEKMSGESMNIEQNNIGRIKDLFPNVVVEGKIDFDSLRLMLGDDVDTSREKYQFTWNGKSECIKMAQRPSTATLRPCKDKSKNWDSTENLYIEGDNLEVLKQLQKTFFRRIKMIYIDPPYNTGEDFVYKDDFKQSIENYKKQTNQMSKSNPETSGRYHTDWLSMMYPRLLLARNLLTTDGVIFISIDDHELVNLKRICDEIFGESNYINTICVKAKSSSGASGGGEDIKLKKNIEYLLAYSASNDFRGFELEYKMQPLESYIQERIDDGKNFAYTSVLIQAGEKEFIKEIKAGNGEPIRLYKVNNYVVTTIAKIMKETGLSREEVYRKYINQIFTLENAQTSIRTRVAEAVSDEEYVIAEYVATSGRHRGKLINVGFMGKTMRLVSFLNVLCTEIDGVIYKKDKVGTLWDDLSWSSISGEGKVAFNNGKKPVELIKRLLRMQTDSDSIVLDFFSGSATTAHAVMQLNEETGGNRKFIMIQLPELDDEDDEFTTICDLGEERIRRAGKQIELDHQNAGLLAIGEAPDTGFKVFSLDSTNLNAWDNLNQYDENTIYNTASVFKLDRSHEDVLYEIMLKYGVFDETVHEKIINGKKVNLVGERHMVVCLDDRIDEKDIMEICKLQPAVVVFNESIFADDNSKINAEYNLKNAGVEAVLCI